MKSRKERRLKRALRIRFRLNKTLPKLTVFKSSKHIYAQLIGTDNKVVSQVSTLSKEFREANIYTGNVKAAELVGKMIAEKAKQLSVSHVCFDRSGFKYHGRIKHLADAARLHGLII